MMTKRLYYEDGYNAVFTGQVVSCSQSSAGYEVVLDETAFYPEGGGQPADTGLLGVAKVMDVYEKEGCIYHVTDQPLAVGSRVGGKIDFERRFDLMQQHSGEHIISGLVHAAYGFDNVGFHMSETYTTCDFNGELTKEQMKEIETRANEAVFSDLAIVCKTFKESDIQEIAYRSKKALEGEVRLVTVPGYDTCACCGIHVKTTGAIGLIKLTNVERHRGGTRVTMLCGKRALDDSQQKQEIVSEACKLLSSKKETVIQSIRRLQEERDELKMANAALKGQLFEHKSNTYLTSQEPGLYIEEPDLTGDELRRLCVLLTGKTERCVLVVTAVGETIKYALGSSARDIRPLNALLTTTFQGKGGGKKELCQGSLQVNQEELHAFYTLHIDHI